MHANKTKLCAGLLAAMMLCSFSSCADQSSGGTDSVIEPVREAKDVPAVTFSKTGIVKTDSYFLPDYSQLVLSAPEGTDIRYTLDGSVPDKQSEPYTAPIVLEQTAGNFPTCTVLRAKAFFADGTESETATHTFWTAFDINARFQNLVISVTGDPKEITEKPDGIFYGKNSEQRGRDSERAVSVELLNSDGSLIFSQNAGLRIYGAASRGAALKSVKLFARKSYDEAHGKFAYDGFGTPDTDGNPIDSYDKLVVRNGGNDFQFAFIRDELNQRLAAQAGHTDCEAVLPVVFYLNGSYYGLHWLHESLCDDLLKDKYGGGKLGSYTVLEGSETEKKISETDEAEAMEAFRFNEKYERFSALDLTNDENYQKVCEFLDVENYLNYFAFNIYLNNNDWPQNNQKCYRFVPAEGNEPGQDRLDGRWRFWFHDMDYSEGLYGQDETQAGYNNLKLILTEGSSRYAPLFAALMQRSDCREAFLTEIHRLMNGPLSAKNVNDTLLDMNGSRFMEMRRYFEHLEVLKKTNKDIWIWYEEYQNRTQNIVNFINARAEKMEQFLAEAFPEE